MWKRWAISIAAAYVERIFDKWMLKRPPAEMGMVDELLGSFVDYLRTKRTKTSALLADILADWRN